MEMVRTTFGGIIMMCALLHAASADAQKRKRAHIDADQEIQREGGLGAWVSPKPAPIRGAPNSGYEVEQISAAAEPLVCALTFTTSNNTRVMIGRFANVSGIAVTVTDVRAGVRPGEKLFIQFIETGYYAVPYRFTSVDGRPILRVTLNPDSLPQFATSRVMRMSITGAGPARVIETASLAGIGEALTRLENCASGQSFTRTAR